jgi:hypothetical protein
MYAIATVTAIKLTAIASIEIQRLDNMSGLYFFSYSILVPRYLMFSSFMSIVFLMGQTIKRLSN